MLSFLLFQPDGTTAVPYGGKCIHHAACHHCRLMFELLARHIRMNVEQNVSVDAHLRAGQVRPAWRPQHASDKLVCAESRRAKAGGGTRLQANMSCWIRGAHFNEMPGGIHSICLFPQKIKASLCSGDLYELVPPRGSWVTQHTSYVTVVRCSGTLWANC